MVREQRTEDAEDIAYAMNNWNVLDNLRDGIPFPYTPSDALEYMSFLAKSGADSHWKAYCAAMP